MRSEWQENPISLWFFAIIFFVLIWITKNDDLRIVFIGFPVTFWVIVYLLKRFSPEANKKTVSREDIETYKRKEQVEYFDIDKYKHDDGKPLVYYVGDDGELIDVPSEKPKRTD